MFRGVRIGGRITRPKNWFTDPAVGGNSIPMHRSLAAALLFLASACAPAAASLTPPTGTRAWESMGLPATGTWVGLRGGPPKLRTSLAAALQTQASIRGIIDRAAVDTKSLEDCRWSDLGCFVALGERHDSRVIVVGDLSRVGSRYQLRVARINVELEQIIVEHHIDVDPHSAPIDIANLAVARLTGEVAAKPAALEPNAD